MKNKIIKNLTLGLSCLMFILTISSTVLNHNSKPVFSKTGIHIDMDSPTP